MHYAELLSWDALLDVRTSACGRADDNVKDLRHSWIRTNRDTGAQVGQTKDFMEGTCCRQRRR
jgi:hypothetical protein